MLHMDTMYNICCFNALKLNGKDTPLLNFTANIIEVLGFSWIHICIIELTSAIIELFFNFIELYYCSIESNCSWHCNFIELYYHSVVYYRWHSVL